MTPTEHRDMLLTAQAVTIRDLRAEVERLLTAAMKLNNYLVSDTYDPSTKNVTVRLAAFVDLRDLLGLTPWQPPTDV